MSRRWFEADLATNLERLRQERKAGPFVPLPGRRTTMEERQADGRLNQRHLGLPALRARIVQEGLWMILEPIYEADFSRHSYGFRPNRSRKEAVTYLAPRLMKGHSYGGAMGATSAPVLVQCDRASCCACCDGVSGRTSSFPWCGAFCARDVWRAWPISLPGRVALRGAS